MPSASATEIYGEGVDAYHEGAQVLCKGNIVHVLTAASSCSSVVTAHKRIKNYHCITTIP